MTDEGTVPVFDSGLLMRQYATFTWYPDRPGDYPYYCVIHPWMTGVVSVGDYEPVPVETVQELVFSTSKTSYQYGDYIAVTGNVGNVVSGENFTYILNTPNGNVAIIEQITPFQSGFFSFNYYHIFRF